MVAIISWSQSTNVSWLSPDLENGVTDGVLKIGVNTSGLQPGIHYGNITIKFTCNQQLVLLIIPVTLIINPDVPVSITTWKDGHDAAMSVSVDDSQPSGFDALQANGFKGTYVLQGISSSVILYRLL